MAPKLPERAIAGLHDATHQLVRGLGLRGRAVELGTGSGAFAERLAEVGLDVLAADIDRSRYAASVPFVETDLNGPFASSLGPGQFDLVVAIEVIEHLTSPMHFLKEVAGLLRPHGKAVITSPNLESVVARLKYLQRGRLRYFDEYGDPTHISPIFGDLLENRYLPPAGLKLLDRVSYPAVGFVAGASRRRRMLNIAMRITPAGELHGDISTYVLELV